MEPVPEADTNILYKETFIKKYQVLGHKENLINDKKKKTDRQYLFTTMQQHKILTTRSYPLQIQATWKYKHFWSNLD